MMSPAGAAAGRSGRLCRIAAVALPGVLLLSLGVPARTHAQEPRRQGYAGTPSATAARDLYDRARYEEARKMLDALLSSGVVTAEVLYYRGLVETSAETALTKYFGEVARRFPGTEWGDRALFKIASYRYATGAYITARQRFGEVAWRQGDSPLAQEARYWRAMTWTYSDTEPDSLRAALRLLKGVVAKATSPRVLGMSLLSAGELSLKLGQADSAYVYADQIVESPFLEDYLARALSLQASALDVLGETEQARSIYQIIVNRYADTWEGIRARAWLSQKREAAVQARLDTLGSAGTDSLGTTGTGGGEWTVQIGAYTDMANAARVVMQLQRLGYKAGHATKRVSGRIYVVVLVGAFETRAEALAYGNAMKEKQHITEFTPIKRP